MTVQIKRNIEVPGFSHHQTSKPRQLEQLATAQSMVDFRLSLLEKQLEQLRGEHSSELSKRQLLIKEIQANTNHFIHSLPTSYLATFLHANDVCSLSTSTTHFRSELVTQGLILPHIRIRRSCITAMSISKMVRELVPGSVLSIKIDARLESNSHLLFFLSQRAHEFRNLESFTISGTTVNSDLQTSLMAFFEKLPRNTLIEIHLSGIKKLTTLGVIITSQAASLRGVKVDYLATGHGTQVTGDIIPSLPNIERLYFDVADLSEASVDLLVCIFGAIKNKDLLQVLYFPHVELLGDQSSFTELFFHLRQFSSLKQVVLRFHALFIPLDQVYSIRRSLGHLPCFNISRHFLIALKGWAAWWPPIDQVWPLAESITGRSVFKEQIDFSSFGSCGDREWLKLSRNEKEMWNTRIAPDINSLYAVSK